MSLVLRMELRVFKLSHPFSSRPFSKMAFEISAKTQQWLVGAFYFLPVVSLMPSADFSSFSSAMITGLPSENLGGGRHRETEIFCDRWAPTSEPVLVAGFPDSGELRTDWFILAL